MKRSIETEEQYPISMAGVQASGMGDVEQRLRKLFACHQRCDTELCICICAQCRCACRLVDHLGALSQGGVCFKYTSMPPPPVTS